MKKLSIEGIKNFFQPSNSTLQAKSVGADESQKNLNRYISPVQLQRLRHDVGMWRAACAEAEQAYYPHRVKMQTMFLDTALNGHVFSCMERRKDLTLLRDFAFYNADKTENEKVTELFSHENNSWFNAFVSYALDAIFYGYSLVSLGDLVNGQFPDLTIVKRWHVSPDRLSVNSMLYSLSGAPFMDEPYKDWHMYVKTATENGISPCGYGLFYKIGIYEIFLRNTLGFNGDFVELYSQPYRVGKTTKTDEDERAELENSLKNMGSSGYAIIDPQDEITFLETALGGTGYKGYESLEQRCEKKISKLILGHADAIDSTPGKLGNGDSESNPINKALKDKQSVDGRFIESVVNSGLLPKLRNLGFPIPEGVYMQYSNDKEQADQRAREDESNKATADIAQVMKNAGLKMDEKYFTERTGIPVTAIEPPAPIIAPPNNNFNKRVVNKLESLYKNEIQ